MSDHWTTAQANSFDASSSSGATESNGQAYNPLAGVEALAGLLSSIDIAALASTSFTTGKRALDGLITTVENFASTIDNLNRTTTRINNLLDEVEEPLRRLMPQIAAGMNSMATLGDAVSALGDLSKRLGPLTQLAENAGGLFRLRSNGSSQTPPA
jgi:ABC-type transporter Mla subunit MlaD